jgi:NitT/TauT family transport system substrate-binding protein
MNRMFRLLALLIVFAILFGGCASEQGITTNEGEEQSTSANQSEEVAEEAVEEVAEEIELEKVIVQLNWIKQGEYHGLFNALEQGFYAEQGLDVEIQSGGPDIRPMALVAAGNAQFAVGKPSEIITGRSNDVPVVMVIQTFQDSYTVYMAKKSNGIETIEDISDKKFGVWFGGGEFEAMLMAERSGVGKDNVDWTAQKFSMVEFYEDKFDIASGTIHNEYHIVLDAGYSLDELTVFRASDYGAAMIDDGIYTTEKLITERPDLVQAFVNATIRGWKWGLENSDGAVENILKSAPDLQVRKQLIQVEEANKLTTARSAQEHGLGYLNIDDWNVSQSGLLDLEVIDNPIDLEAAFDLSFWENVPAEYKTLEDLDMDAINERITVNLGN